VTVTRQDIVAALATVEGVEASDVTPDNIVAGAAWPVWSSSTWVTSCYWRTQWYVFVALTHGQTDATSAEGDPLVDAVGDVLAGIGLGGLICEPWVWPVEVGGQTVPVLRFTAVD
jgi:hypothetical protein